VTTSGRWLALHVTGAQAPDRVIRENPAATNLPFGRQRVEATRSDGLVHGGDGGVEDAVERLNTVLVPRGR